tara:strand:- start:1013 stop:2095 length:1083 start_codon:yes stop_codon:yes gene_type:complete
MKKYTVGSLFAGIGGICLGFKQAGCEVVWANEYDKYACTTYRNYFKKHKLYEENIHDLKYPNKLGKVDIITSGFPCQAFSIAGYRKGFTDHRGNLFFETTRFIDEIRPKAFLLENVKNLISHDNYNTFKIIKNTITNDLNYSFIPFLLNSKDYGNIPQTRERIYIIGFRDEANIQTADQIQHELFPRTKMVFDSTSPTGNFKPLSKIKLTKSIRDLLDHGKQDERYYYSPEHQYYPELKEAMVKKDTLYQWRRVYIRENKSNVCPTLTANMGTGGHNVPLVIDKYGIRKLTPKECLRFQGFPEDYNFPVGMANTRCYKQAGNSVVVPVVERIAKEIVKALNCNSQTNLKSNIHSKNRVSI